VPGQAGSFVALVGAPNKNCRLACHAHKLLAPEAGFQDSAGRMNSASRELEIDRPVPRRARATHWFMLVACGFAGWAAAQSVQESLILTSDYLERGVSKSADQPALQGDVSVTGAAGWIAGLFVSSTQYETTQARDAELDLYAGYGRTITENWHARVLIGAYWYPWNADGSGYDYAEVACELAYRDWLSLRATYSPKAPRVVLPEGLVSVAASSAQVSVQQPLGRGLFASAGTGYAHYGGVNSLDYSYFSAGVDYERSPLSVSLYYVGTSAAAKALYDNGSGGGRWVGTLIWRF
jgi:uncharacterized protein (TIGR02001 family)